uniref:Uncharacterized protein n=1 Tax=Ciona savignyi TaxID=51511 RepID=H2YXF5_CIOSA
MKAIRLVGDLTLERLTTERDSDKMKQYDRFPLFMKLRELGWCHLVVECLRSTSHEDREISMNALNSLKPACSSDFQTDGTDGALELLRRLQLEYASLWDAEVAQGDDDGYFKLLHDLSSNVINNLSNWKPKDEL